MKPPAPPPVHLEELARTRDLTGALEALLPALDEFLAFRDGGRRADPDVWRAALDGPLPEHGVGAEKVLGELADVIVAHGLPTGAPGFCGWVTTMPTVTPIAATLAGIIAAPQRWWQTPGNFLELLAHRWLGELLGLPDTFGGSFVSGGAMANLLCLGAARQHAGERVGVDVAADGVSALRAPVVYAPESSHQVVSRALGILGLGRSSLRRIPVDTRRGPDLATLRQWLTHDLAEGKTPVAIVASAGDVNMGAVDPIDAMREIAHEHQVWFHVDGAYGGFGVLDDRVRHLFGDLSRVDSLAVDPHKWMAVPIGCGAGFVRDPALLGRAFAIEAAHYAPFTRRTDTPTSQFDTFGIGSPDHTMEHSAPSRGLLVWSVLKEIGAAGMRARVARHLDCARWIEHRVREHSDLELLSAPVLSICCFRFHPPHIRDSGTLERLNQDILRRVRARGRVVPSSTRVDNKLAIRPCFIGPRSSIEDANAVVEEVLAAARDLADEQAV